MRDKYLLRFINTWNTSKYNIPTEAIYSEACYQRDSFRGKLREYLQNGKDKHFLPTFRVQEYVVPIMSDLEKRTDQTFPMYDDSTYRYPQPAYLVLATWHFLLTTDSKINKFWEKNFRDSVMEYLQLCGSVRGICDSLIQHLHDLDEAQHPLSLFDIPTTDAIHTTTTLPNYNPHLTPTSTSMNDIYYPGAMRNQNCNVFNINTNNPSDAKDFVKEILKQDMPPMPSASTSPAEPPCPIWQQILKELAVPDEHCRESYGWHNVRIALYLLALEELHLYNITERQGTNAPQFYQTLANIFGYAIVQHSIEDNINHALNQEKNKLTYQTEILPNVRNKIK